MYQDDLVKSVKGLRKYLKKLKPTDDYVRGYKDAKVIIDEVLGDVVEVLKESLYCEVCGESPATHRILNEDPMAWERTYNTIAVCDKCKGK